MKTTYAVSVKVESVNEYYEFQSKEEREKFIEMVTHSFPSAEITRKEIDSPSGLNK